MPDFLPFRGLRYHAGGDLSTVSAPPYDVIDEEEQSTLEHADPHNAVRLILPRAHDDRDAYHVAREVMENWRANGVLSLDADPGFYSYRMTFTDNGRQRKTVGIIGAVALNGDEHPVLPHERTLPKARSDRLALLRATRANLDPIWGLSLGRGLSELVPHDEPAATAIDHTGTRHELLPITEADRVTAVREIVAGAPIVLADGHHRYQTARDYAAEHPGDAGAGAIMALVVELSEQQLCVHAIHRLLTGDRAATLRVRVRDAFDIVDAGPNTPEGVQALERQMTDVGGLGLVDAEGLALALPGATVETRLGELELVLHDVDAARFDVGIRTALPDAQLSYRDDAGTVSALVAKGAADAAVLLRPVSIEQIRAAAVAGVRMPEKTTYFAPKPRTGMVFRSLDT